MMSLNALQCFADMRETNMMRLKKGKEQDMKVVGIYCTFCPEELILAAGAIPVSLCGTRQEPIAAAEEILPRNLCPLIKSSFGFAVTDTCPFFHFSDLIVGETTCDGKKKMFERMQALKPVHVMHLPHRTETQESFDLWVAELRRLRSRLEEQFAVAISDDELWTAIDLVNAEKQALKDVHDLNRMEPPLLTGMELLLVSWSKGFSADRVELTHMLKQLADEAKASLPHTTSGRPRVLLTGCPVGMGSDKVVRLVEELGGYVVAMENCSGYKTLELRASRDYDDPIVALAHKYLQIPCSCMSPNPYRLDLLGRMIDDFQADAVIDLTWQACHTYNMEAYDIGCLVKGKGLPFLHLESDYSTSDVETLKVRIEALLEMVGK